MNIKLHNIGKKFKNDWIFKNVNTAFETGHSYALLGPNGSGKSTLLKVISGAVTQSKGEIEYALNNKAIDVKEIYQHLTIAAPYLELIEEFTLAESLDFQENLFPFMKGLTSAKIINDILKFEEHAHKQLKFYSSGMMQRVKLILAILAEKPIVLLDEPATNLDKEGVLWYHKLIEDYGKKKLLIVASNREDEYHFCENRLNITHFK